MVVIDRFHCSNTISHQDPLNITISAKTYSITQVPVNQTWSTWTHMSFAKMLAYLIDAVWISGYSTYNWWCTNITLYAQTPTLAHTPISNKESTKVKSPFNANHTCLVFMHCILSVQHSQCHGCWCVDSLHRQDISTHYIGYVEYVGSCLTRERISTTCVMSVWRNDKIIGTFLCFLWKL